MRLRASNVFSSLLTTSKTKVEYRGMNFVERIYNKSLLTRVLLHKKKDTLSYTYFRCFFYYGAFNLYFFFLILTEPKIKHITSM